MWRSFSISLLLFAFALCQQEKGDKCTHNRTGQNGVCRSFKECPFASKELTLGHTPQTCSFEETEPIVCCPTKDTVKDSQDTVKDSQPLSFTRSKQLTDCERVKRVVEAPILGGGGHKVLITTEFPHMAAIYFEENDGRKVFGCGGSLISERYVLTAAHCLYTNNLGEPKTVRLGDLDITSDEDGAEPRDYNISKLIGHPDYDPPKTYHDIGLIKLDRDVVFDNWYVRPACLESADYNRTGLRVSATGWGQTKFFGRSSDHLMRMDLEVFDESECRQEYAAASKRKLPKGILEEVQVCAGSREKRVDTCKGDSGGPLQIQNGDTYTIIGVTSFGKACLLTPSPGVYTKVSNYIDWIQKAMSD